MKTQTWIQWAGASLFALAGVAVAQTPPAQGAAPPAGPRTPREVPARTQPGMTKCATTQDFLAYRDLKCPQTGGLPLPEVSAEQREKNKELVMRFYQGDREVLAENFIQHDPAEPSTREAWGEFFAYRMKANQQTGAKRPQLGGPLGYGVTPVDASGSPVEYLVAEGDIVVAMRFRWWEWPGGPEPVFKGVFVDIWRVKDGKLAEQWCTATPEDATPLGIEMAKKDGKWVKFQNLNEQ